jgi:putative peptide zinc metalloprotease protein
VTDRAKGATPPSDSPGATAPRRAKLELLVRHDDESFEVQAVSSSAAWIQMRPTRVGTDTFELAEVPSRVRGEPGYILKNLRTERFLALSAQERFLWDQMDGTTSLQEMATAYVLKYGQFNFDIIPTLIRKLQQAQLLTLEPASRLRRVLARNRQQRLLRAAELTLFALERINISSRRVQPFFGRLYRWGGFLLFTPAAAAVCALLGLVGIVAGIDLWRTADIASGFGRHEGRALILVFVLVLISVAPHQLVHGLALVHYHRRVREFGFTFLHGIIPTFYVDVTDIFMASRRARVVTAVSGTFVHLVLGSLWFLVAWYWPHGFFKAFAAISGIAQFKSFVLALWPFFFIEMDGYHVLVDSLGVPTLKSDALAYVGGLLRGASPLRWSREAALYLGYVTLSSLSVAGFIAFGTVALIHFFVHVTS